MSKRTYRAESIKKVNIEALTGSLVGRVVVAIDIAKTKQFATVMTADRDVLKTFTWSHPAETTEFFGVCEHLMASGAKVEVAMEPTGTYGDAIKAGLASRGARVFRVSGKQVHDARALFDGVNSTHDAKASKLIGRLHLEGLSEAWPEKSEAERELRACREVFRIHQENLHRSRNRLEALMARYWPELSEALALSTATALELLIAFGGPTRVAREPVAARTLMRRVGGHWLRPEVVEAVVQSAQRTVGVAMVAGEEVLVCAVAREAREAYGKMRQAEAIVVAKVGDVVGPEVRELVGAGAAAVLMGSGLDPLAFPATGAYEKALGLNLREHSSGTQKGALHITKRGDGTARKLLFFATLRLIQKDRIVRAWYRKKVERDGGRSKNKAVVAVLRKLVKAVWHAARGHAFDAAKLFDVTKLGPWLEPTHTAAEPANTEEAA